MRRALRVPEPRFARDARGLASPMSQVAQTLATDRFGPGAFMVWREVQRAIGELMIWQDGEVTDTMGVTTFFNDFEKFKPWLGRIEAGLRIAPGEWAEGDRDRLLALINALAGVIEAPSFRDGDAFSLLSKFAAEVRNSGTDANYAHQLHTKIS